MSLGHLNFEIKYVILSVSFQTPYDHCFDIIELRVILNHISGVKISFCCAVSICHVYNNVEDNQILLNAINYIYHLEAYFIYKQRLCFDRNEVTYFQKKIYQFQLRGYVYMCIYFPFKKWFIWSKKIKPIALLLFSVIWSKFIN